MIYCLNPDCNYVNSEDVTHCEKCNQQLLINQRYKAVKPIGKGGFARTFVAIDDHSPHQSRCVIKQLLPTRSQKQQQSRQLFIEEVNKLKSLGNHSHIPRFLDFVVEDDQYYLIQEFVDGENLAVELQKEGNFSQAKIISLLTEILPVLQFIHQHKIIHRDIKPENIVRKIDNQQLYLVDFGASKILPEQDSWQTATVIGTAEYVAPEQARGKALYSSDIYSLGVTCVHLLTNRSPFDLIDLENNWIWQEYITEKFNLQLIKIINQMIVFSLGKRYQNVGQIINDLEAIHSSQRSKIWQRLALIIFLGIASLIFPQLFNIKQPQQVKLPSTPVTTPKKNTEANKRNNDSPVKATKSAQQLEEEALTYLMSLQQIQAKYFQQSGKFLLENFNLPIAQGHIFTTKPISDQRIAIIALAKENNLRNFIAMLWGGDENTPENQQKIKQYQPQPDDWGVLVSPNLLSGQSNNQSRYTVRYNYCETEKPIRQYPNFQSLNINDSVPLSFQDLACPADYVYSLSMIEMIGKAAAKTPPAIVFDRDGKNLQIND